MSQKYKIILYYKYVTITNAQSFADAQKELCKKLELKGRIIIANEGINGTLEGTPENIDQYVSELLKDTHFNNTHIKTSEGTGNAFPKLSVKVRNEIVSLKLGENDINPNESTGKYIQAEELHNLLNSSEEFYIIDMRNDYEHKVGHFENSILPKMRNFRDLPKILDTMVHLKDKKIITVCTGGVRCEKASAFLLANGFTNVSQLYGGIVTYMEKYPNQDFLGELYVFDNRVIMGFNTNSPEHKIIGICEKCGISCNRYINCLDDTCHVHFICCENCTNENGMALCSGEHNSYEYPQGTQIKQAYEL